MLRPIALDWNELQNQFRQQYSMIRNTREQLFQAWRSFHLYKNTETLDAYVTGIRQVTALLDYGECHILEVFKNTLPVRLYWVLFPIEDLRLAVETAKLILTKNKKDRKLTGQSFSITFMNVRDGYNSKKVATFDMQDRLDDIIDKLNSMMS